MADVLAPESEDELTDAIASAPAPFEICGTGSKRTLGRPPEAAGRIELSKLKGILAYEPEELILETWAGTRLSEIESLAASRNQHLAFEPPDFSELLGASHGGTIGGVFACNLSGPRRLKAGAARDHILGLRCVTGRGEAIKAGGRVVKNVTGYDLPKLLTGSHGTLAVMTSMTFKVLPRPETEETLAVAVDGDVEAIAVLSRAMQTPCEVSGAAFVPGEAAYLRLEGIASSVAYRRDSLARQLGRPVQVMADGSSKAKWKSIRDCGPLAGTADRLVWRISTAPSQAPAVIAKLRETIDCRYYFDWAGGLIWLSVPLADDGHAGAVRAALSSGHAMLFKAPLALRAAVEVFQPQAPALAMLSRRVKEAFDPRYLLNPGRMHKEM